MIYLDNNATTRVLKEVECSVIMSLRDAYGNPSSNHALGRKSSKMIENARKSVASFLNCKPREIIFTSCGSESNVCAIRGLLRGSGFKRLITTSSEHPSIKKLLPLLKEEGIRVVEIGLEKTGVPKMDVFNKEIKKGGCIVNMMLAHNETGIVYPVEEMVKLSKQYGCLCHTDAVQAAGKILINTRELNVDSLSISGHKFHAPKGIGALFLRDKTPFTPLITGGGQENDMRGGTSPTHQIIGIGKAAEIAGTGLTRDSKRIKRNRDKMEKIFLDNYSDAIIHGQEQERLPNTTFISFPKANGTKLMKILDEYGIAVSTGSACHSGSFLLSSVLNEMGIKNHIASGTLRISISKLTKWDEIERFLDVLPVSLGKAYK